MVTSAIIGTGSYLPENIVTNEDLTQRIDTSDEWIQSRTGIKQRHIAAEGELTSDMAAKAAKAAIDNAGIDKKDVDLIIAATTTPDKTFPSTAVLTQAKLEMSGCGAFDVQAVCSGFIYALSIANSFITSGQYRTVLVIGAEKMSAILDWEDRRTCVLFGDGAGAVVLQATDTPSKGILSTHLYSDGQYQNILHVNSGPGLNQQTGTIEMEGQEVFKHAVTKMADSITDSLKANHLTLDDIKFLIPHQANIRIIDRIAKKMKVPNDKLVVTVGEHANTSAASIPLALDDANQKGLFTPGDVIVLTAIGGGLTWGSCLLRW